MFCDEKRDGRRIVAAKYRRFLREQNPAAKLQAGDDLIRAIFGSKAVIKIPDKPTEQATHLER